MLLGINRQVYYRSIKTIKYKQQIATQVVDMIEKVRMRMPRIGTR